MTGVPLCQRLERSWRFFAAILIPLALSPLLFVHEPPPTTKYKMGYSMLVMGLYWALELAPLPITALFPILLFPILGIQDVNYVTENYCKEANMVFLTGVIVALALEYCNLHRRIALRVMTLVGGSAISLLGATMGVTGFLAMWLSSTTCAVLVLPTVVAIIDEVNESPAVIPNSEIRRKSHASATATLGSQLTLDVVRRDSTSGASNHSSGNLSSRRATFGNVSLVGPRHGHESPMNLKKHHHHGHHHHLHRRRSIHPHHGPRNHGVEGTPIGTTPLPRSQSAEVHFGSVGHARKPQRVSILIHEARGDPWSSPKGHSYSSQESGMDDIAEDEDTGSTQMADSGYEPENDEDPSQTLQEYMEEETHKEKIKTMFLLGIAYAANIGGTAVITGAGPNKIFKEVLKDLDVGQNDTYTEMTFNTWAYMWVPPMIVNLAFAWLLLALEYTGIYYLKQKLFPRPPSSEAQVDEEMIFKWKAKKVNLFLREEYSKLGRISYHETMVLLLFLFTILTWVFRQPETFAGWGDISTRAKSGESTGAMATIVLLFVIPKSWAFLGGKDPNAVFEPLVDWKFLATKIPWGVLLLLGSGFAIADAFQVSGLSDELGEKLEVLGGLSKPLLLLVVIVFISIFTEFVSNYACANIVLPIVLAISQKLEIHPYYLTSTAAVMCSCAFMLPVANPTNTLVFAAGNFSTSKMARSGIILNIFCVAIIYLNTLTVGNALFDWGNYKYAEKKVDESVLHFISQFEEVGSTLSSS